jgi:hypothetical protein
MEEYACLVFQQFETGWSRVSLVARHATWVLQTSIKNALEPIIDPTFSENSFGFRPRRSQKQALEKALVWNLRFHPLRQRVFSKTLSAFSTN